MTAAENARKVLDKWGSFITSNREQTYEEQADSLDYYADILGCALAGLLTEYEKLSVDEK